MKIVAGSDNYLKQKKMVDALALTQKIIMGSHVKQMYVLIMLMFR